MRPVDGQHIDQRQAECFDCLPVLRDAGYHFRVRPRERRVHRKDDTDRLAVLDGFLGVVESDRHSVNPADVGFRVDDLTGLVLAVNLDDGEDSGPHYENVTVEMTTNVTNNSSEVAYDENIDSADYNDPQSVQQSQNAYADSVYNEYGYNDGSYYGVSSYDGYGYYDEYGNYYYY